MYKLRISITDADVVTILYIYVSAERLFRVLFRSFYILQDPYRTKPSTEDDFVGETHEFYSFSTYNDAVKRRKQLCAGIFLHRLIGYVNYIIIACSVPGKTFRENRLKKKK